MSSVFPLPDEGDEVQGPGLPKPIRLSNVIEIAAERLDGGADGSLKEALAVRAVELPATPRPKTIDDVAAGLLSLGSDFPTPLAEAQPVVASAEPQAIGTPEPIQAVEPPPPAEAAETPTATPGPSNDTDTSQAAAETASDKPAAYPPEIAPDATGDGPDAPSAGAVIAPEQIARPVADDVGAAHSAGHARDDVELGDDATGLPAEPSPAPPFAAPPFFPAGSMQAMLPVGQAHGTVHPIELAPDAIGSRPELSLAATPAIVPTPAHSETADTSPRFASALGAAAKLAADATAASEAIENLKRLLERQLPNPAQAPRPTPDEVFAPAPTAHAPPPLPSQEQLPPESKDHEPAAAPEKPLARRSTRNRAWRERRQFDVRGFMAGFALSWAIGAVLYIYLTAG